MSQALGFLVRHSSPKLVSFQPSLMFVRHKRRACDKLKKPEDKSVVILGHIKKSVVIDREGVSSKQVPIMVNWKKPQMIETCNAVVSGDIGGLEHFGLSKMDLSKPPVELLNSKALENAPEEVKKILSLDYRRNRDVIFKLKHELVKSVQQHPRDTESLEVSIAALTVRIRNRQQVLVDLYPYKNQPLKHVLTHLVSSRKMLLSHLRATDYRKFEWLLEKLNILYKPPPSYPWETVARKASIERLTDIWCQELKENRLKGYRRKLEEEQPKFLKIKAEQLRYIMGEEKDLGIKPTVTEDEVSACISRAEEIEKRNAAEEQEEEEYFVFEEEIKKDPHFYISSK